MKYFLFAILRITLIILFSIFYIGVLIEFARPKCNIEIESVVYILIIILIYILLLKVNKKMRDINLKHTGIKKIVLLNSFCILFLSLGIFGSYLSHNIDSQKKTINDEFYHAIEKNNMQKIKQISKQINIFETINTTYTTPLCFAVSKEKYSIVEYLIKVGANVNQSSKDKSNIPVVQAAYRNNLKLVQLLVKNGADVNLLELNGDSGISAIQYAIIHCNFEMVDYLLANGADINNGVFLNGDGPAITLIQQRNSKESKVSADLSLRMLGYILIKGYNVDQKCNYGNALSIAVAFDDIEAVELLMNYHANPNVIIEQYNKTVFELAQQQENKKIIELLNN